MPPIQPGSTPAPLHDIVDVVPIFPYPLPVLIGGGLLLLAVLGWAAWFFLLRKKPVAPPGPRARAIGALVELQGQTFSPYEFGVRISDILRRYIDGAFGIRAVSATSIEFLESIRDNPRFTADERASLRDFLETVDLIKFARVEAGGEELQKLFAAAEAVVRKPREDDKV
jgi:hypothetical protein